MKLKLNEEKTQLKRTLEKCFDFLGHTFRCSDDLHGRKFRKYLNVEPSKKSQKKAWGKIKVYLKKSGHKAPCKLVNDLNTITRLSRYYKRKSQRKCKLYNQGTLEVLINRPGKICI